jgi:hypothetical protein
MFKSIYKNHILLMALICLLLGGATVANAQKKKVFHPKAQSVKKPTNPTSVKPTNANAGGQNGEAAFATPEAKQILSYLKTQPVCERTTAKYTFKNIMVGPDKPGFIAYCTYDNGKKLAVLYEKINPGIQKLFQTDFNVYDKFGRQNKVDNGFYGHGNSAHKGYYDMIKTSVDASGTTTMYYYRWNGQRYVLAGTDHTNPGICEACWFI